MFGVISGMKKSKCLIENKNKIRTFWNWKPSKKKNIEPNQNFVGSYKISVPWMMPSHQVHYQSQSTTLQKQARFAKS